METFTASVPVISNAWLIGCMHRTPPGIHPQSACISGTGIPVVYSCLLATVHILDFDLSIC